MSENRKLILYVIFGALVFSTILYVLNGVPTLHKEFFDNEKKELKIQVDSLKNKNSNLEKDLVLAHLKTDSLIKLIAKKDIKIKEIKKESHEKNDSIMGFNVAALSDFFSRIKTR
jgi:hypothetical protein